MYTAQEPSESPMSCVTWLCQASSASSQAAGWNAARMAEKKGEGGGETPLSPSPKLEERRGEGRQQGWPPLPAPVHPRPLWGRGSRGAARVLPDCAEQRPRSARRSPPARRPFRSSAFFIMKN